MSQNRSIEASSLDFDYVFVVTLGQDLDFHMKAIKRLILAKFSSLALLHFKNFDSNLFLCLQINCKFYSIK